MKIKLRLNIGLTHGQEEVIDTVADWGLAEDAPDSDIQECVEDWANNFIEYGWTPAED
jgi:hypothetical protein